MKKALLKYAIAVLLIVGAVVGTYSWQHHQVDTFKQQAADAKGSVANLQTTNDKLTKELSQANKTVSSLSQHDTYVSGSPCQTPQLALSYEQYLSGGFAADGGVFSYQNTSTTACTVDGFPGFIALDSSGHVVPNGPIPKATGGGIRDTPTLLTLRPNDKVYFIVGWDNSMMSGHYDPANCFTPSLLESTPPGNAIPIIATTNLGPAICNGPSSVSALIPLSAI